MDARSAIGGNSNPLVRLYELRESRRERKEKIEYREFSFLLLPSASLFLREPRHIVAYQKSTRICSHSLIPLPSTVSRARHSRHPRSSPIAIAARYRDGYRRVSSRSSPYIRDASRAACGSPTEQVPGSVPLSERALAVYLVRQPPTWSEITRSSSMLDAGAALMQSSERSKERCGKKGERPAGEKRRPIVVSGEHMPVRSDIAAEYKVALGYSRSLDRGRPIAAA